LGFRIFHHSSFRIHRLKNMIVHWIEKWPLSVRRWLSYVYAFGVRLRLALYRTDYLKTKRLPAFTISVGNITVGGTGKTPLVEYIARYLQERGYSVCILTRGYGRKRPRSRQVASDGQQVLQDVDVVGDEALLLADHLPGVPVIADPDRYAAGQWAQERFGCQVFVLDDAFQHLRLERDLNILVIDALNPFGGEQPLPLGLLREPLSEIARAHAIVLTRTDRPFDQIEIEAKLKSLAGDIPIFYAYHDLTSLKSPLSGQRLPPQIMDGRPVATFCGIGNPKAFFDDLQHFGAQLVFQQVFPDHHRYSQKELDQLALTARRQGAYLLVTTEKDWVRLQKLEVSPEPPLYVAQIRPQVVDEALFKSFLLKTVESRQQF
jgi:tetraacyldisaccharide 4'-kinase